MKTVKRNFLIEEENIRLNKINDFQVVMYFNPSHFNLDEVLKLHIDYFESIGTPKIRIETRYIDTSKKMELYEPLEYFEEFILPLPLEGILKKNELTLPLKLKEDTKYLWKIGIRVTPKTDTLIHLVIS